MNSPWQPTLENELVLLRPLIKKDLEELFFVASDKRIWEQHFAKERAERNGFEKFFKDSLVSKGALVIIDKSSREIIGSSRYYPVTDFPDKIEIGWSFLSPEYWGGTYNRSFKSLMVNHALDFVNDVLFFVRQDNIRSQKAMKNIGGKIVDHVNENIDPKHPDNLIFSISKKMK